MNVKDFWSQRASKLTDNELGKWQATSLTNTEQDAAARKDKELALLLPIVKTLPNRLWLEVGCGVGRMTTELSQYCENIHGVDFVEKFIEIANQTKPANVHYAVGESHQFAKLDYDCCFCLGLLCCLLDDQYEQTLDAISYIPNIVLKESVGTHERFELHDVYSAALQTNYTAVYRSVVGIVADFAKRGYDLKHEEVVDRHRQETHLQILVFARK